MTDFDYDAAVADWPLLSEERRDHLTSLLRAESKSVASPPPPPPRPPQKVALYRHYDADGVLLYVGTTNEPKQRGAIHAKESAFARFVADSPARWYPNREAATKAEIEAIRAERPLFNVHHNDHADRDSRLTRYLIDKKAYDLLTPIRKVPA